MVWPCRSETILQISIEGKGLIECANITSQGFEFFWNNRYKLKVYLFKHFNLDHKNHATEQTKLIANCIT